MAELRRGFRCASDKLFQRAQSNVWTAEGASAFLVLPCTMRVKTSTLINPTSLWKINLVSKTYLRLIIMSYYSLKSSKTKNVQIPSLLPFDLFPHRLPCGPPTPSSAACAFAGTPAPPPGRGRWGSRRLRCCEGRNLGRLFGERLKG